MKVYGIKRLRESEIGNDTSRQAHIGLFQDVIISQGHHQKLIANLYFEENVHTTLAFLDFIQNEDGTLRSPKIRKGNQDDNYIVNGVSYNSLVLEILNLIHSSNTDLNWYILFTQKDDTELDFYLFDSDSILYSEIHKAFGISETKKYIKSDDEVSKLDNILTGFQENISPPHGIKNIWWNQDEKFYMVSPADSFEELEKNKLLWAPLVDTRGVPSASNSMVALLKEGDIVFVYLNKEIIGYYEVVGNMYISSFSWTHSGRAGRKKGNKEFESKGFTVKVSELTKFSHPITLDQIREQREEINTLREKLQNEFEGALYFPFIPQSRSNQFVGKTIKELAGTQSYLTKFPKELISILNINLPIQNLETFDILDNLPFEIKTRKKEYNTYVTNRKLRDEVLTIYDGKCQICNKKYDYINSAGEHKIYAEGAHIKAKNPNIGGEDILKNLMCLCASCHALFDLGALWVDEEVIVRDIYGEIVNQLTVKHDIDESNFEFHRDYFENRRNLN